jgi:hypothetical protein
MYDFFKKTAQQAPSPREIAALVPWGRVLHEVGAKSGRYGRAFCLLHGGDNPTSFTYSDLTGRARCFACGWSGDKLAFLEAALRCDFRTALSRLAAIAGISLNSYRPPSRRELIHAHAHRIALAAAQEAYNFWQGRKLVELTDYYRDLIIDREIAEAAYRQIYRRPDHYSEREAQWWIARLAAIYNEFALLEWKLDIITFSDKKQTRFNWWREEANRECISY